MTVDVEMNSCCDTTSTPSKTGCDPSEVALKSFFLGPQSENADWFRQTISHVLDTYMDWRRSIHPEDGRAISDADFATTEFVERRQQFRREVQALLERFEAEVPKFSPRYIGHMFSETSMPAMVGHVVTLLHNPNNVSGESSRVGVAIEAEAIDALSDMLGIDGEQARGHFTSGGTVANFEAMVRARKRLEHFLALGARARSEGGCELSLFEAAHMGWDTHDELQARHGDDADGRFEPMAGNPFDVAARLNSIFGDTYRGPVILVPDHKHYSWVKGCGLMGLGKEAFWSVKLNDRGLISVNALRGRIDEARRRSRPIMMVVSVAGTTELGAFDPVDAVQDLLDEYADEQGVHIYHHVDAAYGGFFGANVCGDRDAASCVMADGVCRALSAIRRANSVTLDPHKLGYVPYASGAFVATDHREYFANNIDAPYLDFDHERDRGPQTIEGSRSAAGAVATWLTARTIGLDSGGYGRILRRTIGARDRLQQALESTELPVRFAPAYSNILAFSVADDGDSLSTANERTRRLYETFSTQQNGEFFVSRTTLRFSEYRAMLEPILAPWCADEDADELVMIRLCVMNPFVDSRETDTDFPTAFAQAVEEALNRAN